MKINQVVSMYKTCILKMSTSAGRNNTDYEYNERLVRIVKKYPCLYNNMHHDYGKRSKTDDCWEIVAREMNDSAPNCKMKWRNLRVVFARKLKCKMNGTANNYREYYLMRTMSFIIPFMKPKTTNEQFLSPTFAKNCSTGGDVTDKFDNDDDDDDDNDNDNIADNDNNDTNNAVVHIEANDLRNLITDIKTEKPDMTYSTDDNEEENDVDFISYSDNELVQTTDVIHNQRHPSPPPLSFMGLEWNEMELKRSSKMADGKTQYDEEFHDRQKNKRYKFNDNPSTNILTNKNLPNNKNMQSNTADSSKHFLLSLLSDMEKLPSAELRKFKMGVLQLLDNLLVKHENRNE